MWLWIILFLVHDIMEGLLFDFYCSGNFLQMSWLHWLILDHNIEEFL